MYNWPARRCHSHYGDCFAYEHISIGSSPVGFSPGVYEPPEGKPAQIAMLTVEGGTVRFREDGTDPTSSDGHSISEGDIVVFRGFENIQRARFIRADGSPSVQVSYYR